MIASRSIHVLPLKEEGFRTAMRAEDCAVRLAAAERELCAFVFAVEELYGLEAANRAADHWIALAEGMDSSFGEGSLAWRRITVAAGRCLATDRCKSKQ